MATTTITRSWVKLPEFFSVEEAAKFAECSHWTIRRAIKIGALVADQPGPPWGKGWRIQADDFIRWARLSKNPTWRHMARGPITGRSKGDAEDEFSLSFESENFPPQEWAFRLPEGSSTPPVGSQGQLRINDKELRVEVIEPSTEVLTRFGSRTVQVRENKETLKSFLIGTHVPDGPFVPKSKEEIQADIEQLVAAGEELAQKQG